MDVKRTCRLLCGILSLLLIGSMVTQGNIMGNLVVNPSTGDASNPTLLIIIAAISLVGVVVAAILLLPKKKGGKYQKNDK